MVQRHYVFYFRQVNSILFFCIVTRICIVVIVAAKFQYNHLCTVSTTCVVIQLPRRRTPDIKEYRTINLSKHSEGLPRSIWHWLANVMYRFGRNVSHEQTQRHRAVRHHCIATLSQKTYRMYTTTCEQCLTSINVTMGRPYSLATCTTISITTRPSLAVI